MTETIVPLRHRSALRVLGPFVHGTDQALEDETPLFAATASFARENGGPITRAFVDALPVDREEGVLIDSSLVWLTPGLAHGMDLAPNGSAIGQRRTPRFFHEPFPGIATGVRGESNRNLQAIHRMCALGLDCTPEVAEGELAFANAFEAEAFWLPMADQETREREIERRLEGGALIRRPIPLNALVQFGWGTLLRARPAATSGFQLLLRATLYDPRPPVNGRRNLAML